MFYFEKESASPLYQQLYEQLRQQIMEGILPRGRNLPPTRDLAAEYHISRNTVIQAYQQLAVEGYVRSVAGSGYYVEDLSLFQGFYHSEQPERTAHTPSKKSDSLFDFYYGNLDYNCYQSKAWRHCLLDAYDRMADQNTLSYCDPQGLPELRRELANYLHFSRGVRCCADQIILTSGHQYSLSLVARLFSGGNWKFAMEEPGYDGTRTVMQQNRFSPIPIPLEKDGVSIAETERLSHTLLYITPSHQFPMGSVLPITKRLALLQWAAKSDSYILEDDYDSEFRYTGRPIPTLQSIDDRGRVIYLNTFSQTISPSMRLGFLVLPPRLLERYRQELGFYACTVPALEQHVLTRFIAGGHYERHLSRMRKEYRDRRSATISAFRASPLASHVTFSEEGAGLHFLLRLDTNRSDEELRRLTAEAGIRLSFLSEYAAVPDPRFAHTLVINYAGLSQSDLEEALQLLTDVLLPLLA